MKGKWGMTDICDNGKFSVVPFLWKRWFALICEKEMEPVVNVSCGNDAAHSNACGTIASVTSRLCPREKKEQYV